MAAIDTDFMNDRQATEDAGLDSTADALTINASNTTVAPFSPDQNGPSHRRTQSSLLIHQKSPLLLSTPPQVTRALAYSHPFLLPLNHAVGLLTWSTNDQWESFLMVATFWFAVLYGDYINRFAGPLILVISIIFAMYARRYSPMSSNSWAIDKKKKEAKEKLKAKAKDKLKEKKPEGKVKGDADPEEGRKSLDEILDTLQTFTNRCSVLIEPFMIFTEFLATQTTATASTTRPALLSMFLRVIIVSPIWTALSLPPVNLITTQRVVLIIGTIVLTYHSTAAQVTRTLLWRSRIIRAITSILTGLNFANPAKIPSLSAIAKRAAKVHSRAQSNAQVRFPFAIYENQRRWLGLGWTTSLMSYERTAWTDSQLNPTVEPEDFVLPETDQAGTEWRWVEGSEWHIDSVTHHDDSAHDDDEGWVYFDNSWQNGRTTDGWGRYTRRRRWVRDAELVDLNREAAAAACTDEKAGLNGTVPEAVKRRSWFGRRRTASQQIKPMETIAAETTGSEVSRPHDEAEDDVLTPLRFRQKDWDREIGDGLVEGLG